MDGPFGRGIYSSRRLTPCATKVGNEGMRDSSGSSHPHSLRAAQDSHVPGLGVFLAQKLTGRHLQELGSPDELHLVVLPYRHDKAWYSVHSAYPTPPHPTRPPSMVTHVPSTTCRANRWTPKIRPNLVQTGCAQRSLRALSVRTTDRPRPHERTTRSFEGPPRANALLSVLVAVVRARGLGPGN